jgi:hypothetical protein
MTPDHFQTVAIAWFLAVTGVLAWAGKWVLTNKDNIVRVIQAVREIRQRVDEHDDAAGLNPARKGYTDLPGTKPVTPPINVQLAPITRPTQP